MQVGMPETYWGFKLLQKRIKEENTQSSSKQGKLVFDSLPEWKRELLCPHCYIKPNKLIISQHY